MSAKQYCEKITDVLSRIESSQRKQIEDAAERMAVAIAVERRVYLFGSGHSVIPVLDIFPR
ncbi:MAG TPA: SIS domain-containing protein, partial [Pyrinomonadaceae bacterium]|nr:SIS domain-containing protein [Pyrinomonadaceae bacterium]